MAFGKSDRSFPWKSSTCVSSQNARRPEYCCWTHIEMYFIGIWLDKMPYRSLITSKDCAEGVQELKKKTSKGTYIITFVVAV